MTNKQLERDILKAKKRRPSFFGAALAVFSVFYGQFVIQVLDRARKYWYISDNNGYSQVCVV